MTIEGMDVSSQNAEESGAAQIGRNASSAVLGSTLEGLAFGRTETIVTT